MNVLHHLRIRPILDKKTKFIFSFPKADCSLVGVIESAWKSFQIGKSSSIVRDNPSKIYGKQLNPQILLIK